MGSIAALTEQFLGMMNLKITGMIKMVKVGFYDLCGCQGCQLSVIFNEDEILDIVNAVEIVAFRFITGKKYDGPIDVCFIEGAVVSQDDLQTLKKLRERSKVLIALGTCACQGNIQAIRNFTDEKELDYLKYEKTGQIKDIVTPGPIAKYVKVDYSVPGCPPDRDEVKKFIKDLLLGKHFRNYPDPVCRECRLAKNGCLLDEGKICLGPLIQGGCRAVCTNSGFECYGCRGLTDDPNFEEYFKLMKEKNILDVDVKKRLETFISLEVNEKLKGTKWEKLH
ncbi:MAG: NADH:ubiquinone oxidoreductase [Nanoarchaeota archaeon]